MHRTKQFATTVAVAGLTALGAVAVGAGGSGVVGATTPTEPPATTVTEATPEGGSSDRVISVIGTGNVSVTPDMATVWMGVQTRAATTQEALDTVTEKSNALVTTLEAVGVAREDVQTSGLSLWPAYGTDGSTIAGYDASVSVTVIVRDLAKAGEIIDAAQGFVGDGFTLGGINFQSSDPEGSMQEARVEAVENARVRAEQYAAAAGVSVGEVLQIIESGAANPVMFARAEAADMSAGSLAIEPGQQELTASVTVVFAIG